MNKLSLLFVIAFICMNIHSVRNQCDQYVQYCVDPLQNTNCGDTCQSNLNSFYTCLTSSQTNNFNQLQSVINSCSSSISSSDSHYQQISSQFPQCIAACQNIDSSLYQQYLQNYLCNLEAYSGQSGSFQCSISCNSTTQSSSSPSSTSSPSSSSSSDSSSAGSSPYCNQFKDYCISPLTTAQQSGNCGSGSQCQNNLKQFYNCLDTGNIQDSNYQTVIQACINQITSTSSNAYNQIASAFSQCLQVCGEIDSSYFSYYMADYMCNLGVVSGVSSLSCSVTCSQNIQLPSSIGQSSQSNGNESPQTSTKFSSRNAVQVLIITTLSILFFIF